MDLFCIYFCFYFIVSALSLNIFTLLLLLGMISFCSTAFNYAIKLLEWDFSIIFNVGT